MPESQRLLEDIIGDVTSGSTAVARKVLMFYSESLNSDRDFMAGAHGSINSVHAGMGLVRNINNTLFSEWGRASGDIRALAREIESEMERQFSSSLFFASKVLEQGMSIATISNSSAVRDLLVGNRSKLAKVYVLESRPLKEGISLAEELQRNGIDVTVTADAALEYVSRKADVALCGSDSVLGDLSLVHKIGTYPFFMAFREAGKKTFSLTVEMKFERSLDRDSYPAFSQHANQEISSGTVSVYNSYYDITPHSYVSSYIGNTGIIDVDSSG